MSKAIRQYEIVELKNKRPIFNFEKYVQINGQKYAKCFTIINNKTKYVYLPPEMIVSSL